MKRAYMIPGLLLIGGLTFHLTSCNNKSNTNKQSEKLQTDTTKQKKADPNNNPYTDMRNMALGVTADQLGIQLPANQTKIYGVVMDWGLPEGTATLVSFLSGDASLYVSSGGGVIGGVGHDNVKQAAFAFIDKAEKYLSKTTKTETTPLPDNDEVRFYFLTNKGTLAGQEQIKNFENNSSVWLDLFEEGNKVITELRKATPDK